MSGGYNPARPNHFYTDGAGDPEVCEADHNHPGDEPAK